MCFLGKYKNPKGMPSEYVPREMSISRTKKKEGKHLKSPLFRKPQQLRWVSRRFNSRYLFSPLRPRCCCCCAGSEERQAKVALPLDGKRGRHDTKLQKYLKTGLFCNRRSNTSNLSDFEQGTREITGGEKWRLEGERKTD